MAPSATPGRRPSMGGVARGPGAVGVAGPPRAPRELPVRPCAPDEAAQALRRGRVAVGGRPAAPGPATLVFDPARPETRLAHLEVEGALERAAGRRDPVPLQLDTRPRAGSRYIHLLLPRLPGLDLLGPRTLGLG